MYRSKYLNLDSWAKWGAWNREDFAWAVEQLETAGREKLLKICSHDHIRLTFDAPEWERNTPDEQIIIALLTDYSPEVLLLAIRATSNS